MIMVDSVSINPAKPSLSLDSRSVRKASETAQKLTANPTQTASLPKLVQMASALAQQGTPIDYAKIAQIRHAIANGDYKIDTSRIADAMLRFHSQKDPE
jgi:flagellar biosynthesis anti-sigma factor FlgM